MIVPNIQAQAISCSDIFRGPYETIELVRDHVGENLRTENPVQYFTDAARNFLTASFKDGLVMNSRGELIDLKFALYVMDASGRIIIHHLDASTRHSAIMAGSPIAGAGHITISSGHVTYLDNLSGHYMPGKSHFDQVVVELHRNGVDLSSTEFFLKGVGTIN